MNRSKPQDRGITARDRLMLEATMSHGGRKKREINGIISCDINNTVKFTNNIKCY